MATEDEIHNMAISLSKTGVAANMKEAVELAKSLLNHQEEKQRLKEELKQKEEKEREQKQKELVLPPVRLGVEDIDLSKSLKELLSERDYVVSEKSNNSETNNPEKETKVNNSDKISEKDFNVTDKSIDSD